MLLAAADLLVSPVRYEAYGLNVHEALCRGAAVMVTRTAGVVERFDHDLEPSLLPSRVTAAIASGTTAGLVGGRGRMARTRSVHSRQTSGSFLGRYGA